MTMRLEARPAPRCLECGQPFDRERVPVMARPLSRMPGSRLVPAVSVTLYGSVCGPCAGVAPESPPQAAQEAAGEAMTPKPADAPRQLVRCTDCRHAAGLPYGRYCPTGKRHANGYPRTCHHFEPKEIQ